MSLSLVLSGGYSFAPTGLELYEKYPEVRASCALVQEWTGLSFPDLLETDLMATPELRRDAPFRQIALVFGVADVLTRMGVRPKAIGGVSLGEMIGAALAGAVGRRELCGIYQYLRENVPGRPPGDREPAFAGLTLPAGESVDSYVGGRYPEIYLGADNFGTLADGSRILTISGYLDDLKALAADVEQDPARKASLQIYEGWGALHSPVNQYIKDVMAPYLSTVDFRDPELPFFSGRVDGQVTDAAGIRAGFTENYTSFVSVTRIHDGLAKFGTQLGITLVSWTAPELNRFPFPVVQVQTPEDVEEAVSTMFELGVDFR